MAEWVGEGGREKEGAWGGRKGEGVGLGREEGRRRGPAVLINSYLPQVHGLHLGVCLQLSVELVRMGEYTGTDLTPLGRRLQPLHGHTTTPSLRLHHDPLHSQGHTHCPLGPSK
ncbi:hypothetical protein Pcinc_038179 [Petrolisthes cinctipes]|uniref:Uncharacterized protein n=1 Tax=Petrolisthes cinctipes TaxID=88211 RepID=A0AAE1ENA3_PETCI|nr:hypothetical protein Pcinc_038179 [Petrolisthes cinctipes]